MLGWVVQPSYILGYYLNLGCMGRVEKSSFSELYWNKAWISFPTSSSIFLLALYPFFVLLVLPFKIFFPLSLTHIPVSLPMVLGLLFEVVISFITAFLKISNRGSKMGIFCLHASSSS